MLPPGDCAASGSPGRDEVSVSAKGTEDSLSHAEAVGCSGDPPGLGSALGGGRTNLCCGRYCPDLNKGKGRPERFCKSPEVTQHG